jgi:hypothetical protein
MALNLADLHVTCEKAGKTHGDAHTAVRGPHREIRRRIQRHLFICTTWSSKRISSGAPISICMGNAVVGRQPQKSRLSPVDIAQWIVKSPDWDARARRPTHPELGIRWI